MIIINTVGNYIKRIRKEKQVTSRKLAELSLVSQAYISQIETGKHSNPSPDVLERIAKALDIPYLELMIKAGYLKEDETDWTKFDLSIKEFPERLKLEIDAIEITKNLFEKGIDIPVWVDEENNIKIQIYSGNNILNEVDTKILNAMIKGFLFDKKFIDYREEH